MAAYTTIDYLPDLTLTEIASAQSIAFAPYTPSVSSIGWDSLAQYNTSEDYAILRDIFVFQGKEGATYDIYSFSYFDPYILELFDDKGNVIAVDDRTGTEGMDHIKYVAPYTGNFYINASWHQGTAANKFVRIAAYEDIDTAHGSTPTPVVNDVDRIFNWAEQSYSDLFPSHPESQSIFGYYARIYSNGDALGEKDGNIYYYDGGTNGTGETVLVGVIADYLPQAATAGF